VTSARKRRKHRHPEEHAVFLSPISILLFAVGLELEVAHRRAERGYWIGVPYLGNGYATEAARAVVRYGFDVLKLHRIFASHFQGNPASGKVLQKVGMKYEGRLRNHVRKWDQFQDLEFYGILESDFRPG
jgi:ribosomal-protein-alanine N-acetyltransferase